MNTKKIRSVALQLLILLVIYQLVQTWQTRSVVKGSAPPIMAISLDGRQLSLEALRGQPVLVHFWASWCGICKFEQPAIDAIAQDHAIITIASLSGDSTQVLEYVKENHIRSPIIVDEGGRLARLYGVKGFPASFIVKPDGGIYDVEVGYSSEYGLRFRLWLAGLGI